MKGVRTMKDNRKQCKYVGNILEDLSGEFGVAFPDENEGVAGHPFENQWFFVPEDRDKWPKWTHCFFGYLVHASEIAFV
jgi:hypothetical protein